MADDLLGDLLRQVSRSFYLSLAILPRPLREPVGLAYLVARAADTVADTRLIAREERVRHLETLRSAAAGQAVDVAALARACAPHQADPAERRLLEHAGEALARVAALPQEDRERVRAVLATLTTGMLFDLTRFPGEDAASLAALDTLDELDRYTYLVAGCVGPFWTALHVAHRPRLRRWDLRSMSEMGVRFGKALQMTNVLRDVANDLRNGRCYLPAAELAALGLVPKDLLERGASARVRPLYRRLLATALDHYDVAWRYALAIPRLEWRMRLACAWPLLIGLATLAELTAHPDPLAVMTPIKIPRRTVRALLARSAVTVWSDAALAADAARLRRRITP
jgi:farnesyl-diphosphate farnesyltransferase